MALILHYNYSLFNNTRSGFNTLFEFLQELMKKILLSILSRFILNEAKRFFNNPENNQFYSDAFEATMLLLMCTLFFITTILLTTLAVIFGFSLIKFAILFVFLSFTIVLFREHKKVVKKYTN